jgi:hypothetical protein
MAKKTRMTKAEQAHVLDLEAYILKLEAKLKFCLDANYAHVKRANEAELYKIRIKELEAQLDALKPQNA